MTLTGLTIPESVELIADSAFYYCPNLNKVIINGTPEIAPTAFLDCGTGLEIIKTGIDGAFTNDGKVIVPVLFPMQKQLDLIIVSVLLYLII